MIDNIMDKTLVYQVFLVIWTFTLTNVKSEYDVARYCQLVPKGTKFPSFDSCQTYYTCLNANEIEEASCSDTQIFNKDTQSCITGSCNLLADGTNPCNGLHNDFAAHPNDCRWWHYCEYGKISHSATCPSGQHFNGHSCVYGKCEETTEEVKNLCKVMQNDQFFGDFDDCTKWQKCRANAPIAKDKCAYGYVFDVELRMCAPYEESRCKRSNGYPIIKPVPCEDNALIPDKHICSVYYKCKNKIFTKYECPRHEYFDTLEMTCKPRQNATTIETCDRCQFSSRSWVNAVDSNCRKYYTCKDSKRNGDHTKYGECTENSYFNEDMQVCLVASHDHLKNYAKNNGACGQRVCLNFLFINDTVQCLQDLCKNENNIRDCKIEACNEIVDDIKEKIECKLKACANDSKCKVKACDEYNETSKQVKCIQEHCKTNETDKDCKIEACNKYQHDLDEKVKCKQEACTNDDIRCKEKACEDFKSKTLIDKCIMGVRDNNCENLKDDEAKLQCKFKACELERTFKKQKQCKFAHCIKTADNGCQEKACESFFQTNETVLCLHELCENSDGSGINCKVKACNKFENDTEEKVQCKLLACENDSECKVEACEDYKEDTEKKVQCKLLACENDSQCRVKACEDYEKTEERVKCKQDHCVNEACKIEACNEYKVDLDEKVKCKQEACDDIECKEKTCTDFKLKPLIDKCIMGIRNNNCENLNDEQKLECKFKACEIERTFRKQKQCKFAQCEATGDVECQKKACHSFFNTKDKIQCLQDLCQSDDCKVQVCDIHDNDMDEKLNCKHMACGKDDTCKAQACNDYTNTNLKVNCLQNLCQNDNDEGKNCKIKACNVYENDTEEKVQCKLKACENDSQCKVKACEDHEKAGKRVKCKQDHCINDTTGKECKVEACNEYNVDLDEKVKCKQEACGEDAIDCKEKACEDFKLKPLIDKCIMGIKNKDCENLNDEEKLQCKFKACELERTFKKQKQCKFAHCKKTTDDGCQEKACESFSQTNETVLCLQELCENLDNELAKDCKIKACFKFENDTEEKVQCKLLACENDSECKLKACEDHEKNTEEKVQCKLLACDNDSECKLKACGDYKDDKKRVECLQNHCVNEACKTEACNEFKIDLDEKIKCKQNACAHDDIGCKEIACKDYDSTKDELNCRQKLCENTENAENCKANVCKEFYKDNDRAIVQCKLETCGDVSQCKIKACEDYKVKKDIVECKQQHCEDNRIEENCKVTACEFYDKNNDKVECKHEACKDENCKITACNDYKDNKKVSKCKFKICDEREDLNEKIICKLESCNKDETCQKEACKSFANTYDTIKCQQELCPNDDSNKKCKKDKCNAYIINKTERVKCKQDVCDNKDVPCKQEACEDHKLGIKSCKKDVLNDFCQNAADKESCKFEACEEHNDIDKRIECKLLHCGDSLINKDKCKKVACKTFEKFEDQIKCLQELCRDKSSENCKIKTCNEFKSNTADKVKCLQEFCKNVESPEECKIKTCNTIEDNFENKVKCLHDLCEENEKDQNCRINKCNEFDKTDDRRKCKHIACQDVSHCNVDICESHSNPDDVVTCKQKFCKDNETGENCKLEACEYHTNVSKKVDCKKELCNDIDCKHKVCIDSYKKAADLIDCKLNNCNDTDIQCKLNVCEEESTKSKRKSCKKTICKNNKNNELC